MWKRAIILVGICLLASGCNYGNLTGLQNQVTALQSQNQQLQNQNKDLINKLTDFQKQLDSASSTISQLNQQVSKVPTVITKVVQVPVVDNSDLKIEQCKAKWLDANIFPGTSDDLNTILNNADYQLQQAQAIGDNSVTLQTFVTDGENLFRSNNYQTCLSN